MNHDRKITNLWKSRPRPTVCAIAKKIGFTVSGTSRALNRLRLRRRKLAL